MRLRGAGWRELHYHGEFAPYPFTSVTSIVRLSSPQTCCICATSTEQAPCVDVARLRCNVREFSDQFFTMWRCAHCHSLHCLESIDFARYYANYPIRRQKYDYFARHIFQRRLQLLVDAGLRKGATLLDYGCGSGYFVRFARSKGIRAEGYDPYSSEEFSDRSVLERRYDFVTSQDVIEHDEHPGVFLNTLRQYVRPGGALAIGTPNADRVDLKDPLAPMDAIHVPYHRHLYSQRELELAMGAEGWQIIASRRDSYFDSRFPFVNSAFLVRFFRSRDGTMDSGFDPVGPMHFLRFPSLIFWGLLGSWAPGSPVAMTCS